MPYKDPERKKEWEKSHRAERSARRRKLRQIEAVEPELRQNPQIVEVGTSALLILIGYVILTLALFFYRRDRQDSETNPRENNMKVGSGETAHLKRFFTPHQLAFDSEKKAVGRKMAAVFWRAFLTVADAFGFLPACDECGGNKAAKLRLQVGPGVDCLTGPIQASSCDFYCVRSHGADIF